MTQHNNQEPSLEDLMGQLESLTNRLEGGQLSIDEAIKTYTEGLKLANQCKKHLDNLTQKISVAREQLDLQQSEQAIATQQTQEVASDKPEADEIPF